jgi:hypothetical protein
MPTPFSGLFIIGKERLQDNGGCSKRTRDPGHNHPSVQREQISGSLAHCYNVNAALAALIPLRLHASGDQMR